ncbi:MAG: hypothetical protein WC861_04235 [Candidatus Micrarchaeia archaeon]
MQYETAKIASGAWRARRERDSWSLSRASGWKLRIDRYIALQAAFERRRLG